nr:bifunctional folylpolyglutamate synthase/dihydrofolate synthase [Piscinibacter sp.]
QMGFHPRTHAVFGAMRDKDVAAIIARMVPLVDSWHFTDLPLPRAARAQELAGIHATSGAKAPGPVTVQCHPDPQAALAAALAAADPADRIVVFGSFYTVGGVLKDGVPRLGARHVG